MELQIGAVLFDLSAAKSDSGKNQHGLRRNTEIQLQLLCATVIH